MSTTMTMADVVAAGSHDPNTQDATVKPEGSMNAETRKVKLHGKEVVKTIDELVTAGTKFLAGEDTLREAAEIRKNLETERERLRRDAEVGQLLRDVAEKKDMESFYKVLERLGKSPEEIQQVKQAYTVPAVTAATTKTGAGQTGKGEDGVTTDDLVGAIRELHELVQRQASEAEGLRGELDYLRGQDRTTLRGKLQQDVFRSVDSDPILGKITKKTGPRAQELREMVWEAVQEETRLAKAYGPEILSKAIDRVRSRADDLGILESTRTLEIPGIGSVGGTPLKVDLDKSPKIGKLTSPDAGDEILQQLAHYMATHAEEE